MERHDRRSARRAGVVALALACVVGACDTAPSPSSSPALTSATTTASGAATAARASDAPTSEAPVGASVALELVDSGFSTTDDGSGGRAYYAAILRNPNEALAAANVELEVDFYDAAENFIAGEEPVVNLLPGQTGAVAGQAFGAASAARFEVNVPDDATAFLPRDSDGESFAVSELETIATPSGCVTTGRLTSTFTTEQRFVQLAAVYRDAAGAIVAGASGGIESVAAGGSATFEIAESVPCEDVAATEVFWQVGP